MYSPHMMAAETVNRSASGIGPPGEYEVPARRARERRGYSMYIGVGTLVVILIIVLIIYFIRRS